MSVWVHLELLLVQVLFAGLALSAKRALATVPANAIVVTPSSGSSSTSSCS